MEVLDIKTRLLPDWDNHLAGQIKENLTITQLEEQVKQLLFGFLLNWLLYSVYVEGIFTD